MAIVNTKKHPDKRRVEMDHDVTQAIMAVSDGLIGNVAWLTELVATRKPPKNMMGLPVGHLISIDDMGVYGEPLWDLFKHTLDCDLDQFAALSEALQTRSVTANEIRDAARDYRNKTLKTALLKKIGGMPS
ncbi:hypothetical protein O9X98_04310 [Agrobacterium salinitolerans]|nr:hypothetical protein [Agrobacterium salinitolerans]